MTRVTALLARLKDVNLSRKFLSCTGAGVYGYMVMVMVVVMLMVVVMVMVVMMVIAMVAVATISGAGVHTGVYGYIVVMAWHFGSCMGIVIDMFHAKKKTKKNRLHVRLPLSSLLTCCHF